MKTNKSVNLKVAWHLISKLIVHEMVNIISRVSGAQMKHFFWVHTKYVFRNKTIDLKIHFNTCISWGGGWGQCAQRSLISAILGGF